MQAGVLNDIMYWKHPDVYQNDFGEQETVWSEPKKIRCSVKYNYLSRNNVNQDMVYDEETDFIIRYYHKICDYDIVIWNNDEYRILSIELEKDKQRKILRCQKIMD